MIAVKWRASVMRPTVKRKSVPTEPIGVRSKVSGYGKSDPIRGRVFSRGSVHGKRVWFFEVYDGNALVFHDNTCSFESIYNDAVFLVEAMREMRTRGQQFKPWAEVSR